MNETISSKYTLAYLANHPKTKDIVLKHLRPILHDDKQLGNIHATLQDLCENMGGGIPYGIMRPLIDELNSLTIPL
jgi:hypothetical protein